jgi:hypothetical protein
VLVASPSCDECRSNGRHSRMMKYSYQLSAKTKPRDASRRGIPRV